MSFLVFSGVLAFIFGIMFILFPQGLRAIAEWTNRLSANVDSGALKYRLGLGISLLLTSACLLFVAYYLKVIPVLRSINS